MAITASGDKLLKEVLLSKKYRILRHAFLLLTIGLFSFNLLPIFRDPYDLYAKASVFFTLLVLYYFNMYWLVPGLLLHNKLLTYLLYVLAFIGITYVETAFIHRQFEAFRIIRRHEGQPEPPGFLALTFMTFIMAAASASIKLLQRWLLDNDRIHALEQLTIRSELEMLRRQITPHFLFNTLNNASVLMQRDPPKASDALIRLSDILRYQLYDSERDVVFLTSEIRFLDDFLNLENIRRDEFEYRICKEGDLAGLQVPPLLFVTFVENAVKYSSDAVHRSFIHLKFSATGNRLFFKCVNSKPAERGDRKPVGGLGLANVRKRLSLLKPDTHLLKITDMDSSYMVELNMVL
jgi:hypothetical protein